MILTNNSIAIDIHSQLPNITTNCKLLQFIDSIVFLLDLTFWIKKSSHTIFPFHNMES